MVFGDLLLKRGTRRAVALEGLKLIDPDPTRANKTVRLISDAKSTVYVYGRDVTASSVRFTTTAGRPSGPNGLIARSAICVGRLRE